MSVSGPPDTLWAAVVANDANAVSLFLNDTVLNIEEEGGSECMVEGCTHIHESTPLEEAVFNFGRIDIGNVDNVRIIQMLLEAGANVNTASSNGRGFSFLHDVMVKHSPFTYKICELFLRFRIDVNAISELGKGNALHIALEFIDDINERLKVVTLLTEYNINIEVKNNRGRTPLYLATKLQFFDEMKVLLELDADANAITDDEERTPLHIIVANNYFSPEHGLLFVFDRWRYISLLIDHGVDIYKKDYNGETAVDLAHWRGEYDLELQIKDAYAKRRLAFAMMLHPRSSVQSWTNEFNADLVRMILDQ